MEALTGVRALAGLVVVLSTLGLPGGLLAGAAGDVIGVVALALVGLLGAARPLSPGRLLGVLALAVLSLGWLAGYAAITDRPLGGLLPVLSAVVVVLAGYALAPLVGPLLTTTARRLPRALGAAPLVALGAATDALVITHHALAVPLTRGDHIGSGPQPWAALATVLVVLLVVAEGAHRYAELPARSLLGKVQA